MNQDNLTTLRDAIRDFAQARDWEQFHTPKNLVMALSVETAELMEHFQWLTPDKSMQLNAKSKTEVGQEIADVLTRPKLQARYSLLTKERADKLIEILKEKAKLIEKIPSHFTYPRDPKDEKYINLAIQAKADYIVSRDGDLLDLKTNHTEEAKDFRRRFRSL